MNVLFTRSMLMGSRLIQWLTTAPVSHCAVEWNELVFHASFGGVQITSKSRFYAEHRVIYIVPVSSEKEPVLVARLLSKEGLAYDYKTVIYLAFIFLWKKLSGKFTPGKISWANNKTFDCTELVSYAILGQENPTITPYELYQLLTKPGPLEEEKRP